ncbi:Type 1 glutamine amidotransferase-like domain-containing protein [Brevibacillus ginsengisoli]|uniref:Type 1 glutamine amidotransferase-like domain-containing protein n=1 Tax=Brevibacillus ginsengisoli TaxID=363854 RepID=UPI003CF32A77
MKPRQIIALGGGGFSSNQERSPLDRYILKQSGKANPRICFIPTASGDSEDYIQRFYRYYEKQNCQPSHLSLLKPNFSDLEAMIMDQDILFVGGGNTRNLLALWGAWGLDEIIREAWKQGIVLAGISAGSICWFEQGLTDSVPGRLSAINALGFLPGSNCPHYDSEASRRLTYLQMIARGELLGGYAVEDQVALHFIGTQLYKAVTSSDTARAYQVRQQGDQVGEGVIMPERLTE